MCLSTKSKRHGSWLKVNGEGGGVEMDERQVFVRPNRGLDVDTTISGELPKEMPLVITKRYDDAKDFLSDISYGGALYGMLNKTIVFRGLQSATYELIPSALRRRIQFKNQDGTIYKENEEASVVLSESERLKRSLEYFSLRGFFDACDVNGLWLPNVERIRKYLVTYKDLNTAGLLTDEWIPYDFLELTALAQHYGIETRLLDWTSNIETAIYFAVHKEPDLNEEEEKKEESKYLAIWLLDTSVEQKSNSLRFIRPPYKGNPNLAAQKGLFSYWKEPGFKLKSNVIENEEWEEIQKVRINRMPLDKRLLHELGDNMQDKTYMWKLLIPREGKKELYGYISRRGVTAASLFPGYAGIVQSIKEGKEIMSE